MGSDDSVADAARVSFDKLASMFTPEENAGLIRFLARGCTTKKWRELIDSIRCCDDPEIIEEILLEVKRMPEHWTPFAHTAITLRMGAPVPIRTQCFKHKQGLVENEESRRYISSKPELFIPDRFRRKAANAKQGSGGVHPDSDLWMNVYRMQCEGAIAVYERMIANEVCPEQARFILPQGVEVNWIWTGNLFAFANFFNKRTDSHAQQEIQELAHEVGRIIEPLFPVSWAALTR
jgi:thymidylate synthase (FAD)